MSDLIDRKAAIEAIRSYCAGCNNYDGIRCRSCGIADAADKVEEVPTVDAEPLRRGRWEHCAGKTALWYCSECGERIIYNPDKHVYNIARKSVWENHRFCRACGARMERRHGR